MKLKKTIVLCIVIVFVVGSITFITQKHIYGEKNSNAVLYDEDGMRKDDPNNGNWYDQTAVKYNTDEADFMVRVGDMDNFGFGWRDSGMAKNFNLFEGKSTKIHSFPFSPKNDYNGTDRIMVNSGYKSNGDYGIEQGARIYYHNKWGKYDWNYQEGKTVDSNGYIYKEIESHDIYWRKYRDHQLIGYLKNQRFFRIDKRGNYKKDEHSVYATDGYGKLYRKLYKGTVVLDNGTRIDYDDTKGTFDNTFIDGYTNTTKANAYDNKVRSIKLNYQNNKQFKKIKDNITRAKIEIFVDDFQAGAAEDRKGSKHRFLGKYQVRIDNERVPEMEKAINSLNQSGPIGRLITMKIPDRLLKKVKNGNLSINIDDPVSQAGDGYAIDFVKLLINYKDPIYYGSIKGKVTEKKTGKPIKGVEVSVDSELTKTYTDENGNYKIDKVPAGTPSISVKKSGFVTQTKSKNLVKDTSETVNFSLERSTTPKAPIITLKPKEITNKDVIVTIEYPDNPGIKEIWYDNPEDDKGADWYIYKGEIKISKNQTIKARGKFTTKDYARIYKNPKERPYYEKEKDIPYGEESSLDITNIDKEKPEKPTITESNSKTIPNKTITVDYHEKDNEKLKKYIYYIPIGQKEVIKEEYKGPVEVDTTQVIKAQSVDIAGNESEIATYKVDIYKYTINPINNDKIRVVVNKNNDFSIEVLKDGVKCTEAQEPVKLTILNSQIAQLVKEETTKDGINKTTILDSIKGYSGKIKGIAIGTTEIKVESINGHFAPVTIPVEVVHGIDLR